MLDPRTPCVVGVASQTWHPGTTADSGAPEPLTMWERVTRAAEVDAGVALLDQLDSIDVVYCQTWQGTATGEPGRVFVTVAFSEKRQPCPHVIGVFDYVLAVRGIPSGVYQVIVTVRELAGNDPPRDQTFQFNGVSIP